MHCLVPSPSAVKTTRAEPRTATLTCAAIFDDLFDGVVAIKAMESLALSLRPGWRLNRMAWNFGMLQRLDLRHLSVHRAAEADLLIIAASADLPLPHHVKDWLERLGHAHVRPLSVLVSLHDQQSDCGLYRQQLCRDLEDLSHRWQCEFLCNGEFDRRLEDGLAVEIIHRRARVEGGLEDNDPSAAHWGINE